MITDKQIEQIEYTDDTVRKAWDIVIKNCRKNTNCAVCPIVNTCCASFGSAAETIPREWLTNTEIGEIV